MYNPSFLLGGSGSLIAASIFFVFIYSNVTSNIPLAGLGMYALMWGILITTNIVGSLIGTSPDDPNEPPITVAFISSIVYFTIVGFMVMLLKLCPNIIRIFDNSISYLIVTQVLPLFWFNTYTEANIDNVILSNVSSTTTASMTEATTLTPEMPNHLLIATFNDNTLTQSKYNVEGVAQIQKLLTLLQTVSTFIIMTFSLIVAFLVSNIAIQLTRERKA